MKNFESWKSFWFFEQAVKNKNRYFRDDGVENFLQSVLESSERRKKAFPKKQYLWRAQLGHAWKPCYQGKEYIDDIPTPFTSERMKPLMMEASEGRANPKGIPYLYTATTKETAMAEVKPWLGSLISIGQFKTKKDLVLIDCSVHYNKTPLYLEEPNSEGKEQAVWSHIDKSFSKPMTNSDRVADYIPTQILAEFFKCNDFDGIIYKSMLGDGFNIVLFDVESAELVGCHLFELVDISFSFQQAADPYIVLD